MRKYMAAQILALAIKDPRIVILTADLGYGVWDEARDTLGDRFINVGCREQAMAGIAAGLAMAGMRPVIYSICNFLVHRAFEQIRIDIVHHNLPVLMIGVGRDGSYKNCGITHDGKLDAQLVKLLRVELCQPKSLTGVDWFLGKWTVADKPLYLRLR